MFTIQMGVLCREGLLTPWTFHFDVLQLIVSLLAIVAPDFSFLAHFFSAETAVYEIFAHFVAHFLF